MITAAPAAAPTRASWVSANDAALEAQHRAQVAASPPVEILASRIDAIVRFDRRARLGEIAAPTLIDYLNLPAPPTSEELASAIPDAKLHVLSGGGHFAPVIVPDEYNAAVGAFLAGHRHL